MLRKIWRTGVTRDRDAYFLGERERREDLNSPGRIMLADARQISNEEGEEEGKKRKG